MRARQIWARKFGALVKFGAVKSGLVKTRLVKVRLGKVGLVKLGPVWLVFPARKIGPTPNSRFCEIRAARECRFCEIRFLFAWMLRIPNLNKCVVVLSPPENRTFNKKKKQKKRACDGLRRLRTTERALELQRCQERASSLRARCEC